VRPWVDRGNIFIHLQEREFKSHLAKWLACHRVFVVSPLSISYNIQKAFLLSKFGNS